ncbi:MAG: hypothetical protein AUI36_39490 [Cyanobacteria bacterium 13_1_40CM_2_61_4]|nr:MAG: hypothetical protein AUI36_39490 [Cyanobacteria bacterium 13_1_40CM_2_61_4]
MAEFLGEEELLSLAQKSAERVTEHSIDCDQRYDLVSGAAGAILALIRLYRTAPREWLLSRANDCGSMLLKRSQVTGDGRRCWSTMPGTPLIGMSHGATGIAYALLRLYEFSGTKSFGQAAMESVAYERALFDEKAGDWPDLRFRGESRSDAFTTTWCHGAPGIGLARIATLDLLNDPSIRLEIEHAVRATAQFGVRGVDHVCCGNFGRIEFLSTAGIRVARPEWCEMARKFASRVLDARFEGGGYRLFQNLPRGISAPGFFQGMAGIGYSLLRLANSKSNPCVLTWD